MALPTEILKFKSPGVKQILQIADNIPQTTVPTGARILVVNSKKGPVNQLTAVSDFTHYKSIFDDVSDADERRGNWSARSAKYMLDVAPIYVLNLRSFDDTLDTAGFVELSTEIENTNGVSKTKPYKKLYNTQQFWKVDSNQLLEPTNTDKLLVFGNVGSKPVSVFVRKTKSNQYNQTLDVWYKNLGRTMPPYVNPLDKVSDWMVDVYVFNNTFNNTSATNNNYGYCFDVNGNVKKDVVNSSNNVVDGLDQLAAIPESGYLATFTGSLINGFLNESNSVIDIVSILNSYVNSTGLLVARNESLFDTASIWNADETPNSDGQKKPIPVDFKGHSVCHINEVGNFDWDEWNAGTLTHSLLSYTFDKNSIDTTGLDEYVNTSTLIEASNVSNSVLSDTQLIKHIALLKGDKNNSDVSFNNELNKFYVVGSILKPSIGDSYVGYDGNLATVSKVSALGEKTFVYDYNTSKLAIQPFGDDVDFVNSHDWEDADGQDNQFTYANAGSEFPKDPTGKYYVYPQDHILSGLPLAYANSDLSGILHNPNPTLNDYFLDPNVNMTIVDYQTALTNVVGYSPTTTGEVILMTDVSEERLIKADKLQAIKSAHGTKEYIYEVELDKNLVVNKSSDSDLVVDLSTPIVFDSEKHVLTDDAGNEYITYNDDLCIFRVNGADKLSKVLKPITLKAYTPRQAQFLDGTKERQNDVLNVLKETSIANGLQNQDLYDWMYIVDGFKSFIEPNVKYQLKDIAKERITGRAIYNLPLIYEFANSTNPYFRETTEGDFEVKFIPQGGNLELPHNNTFSMPSEDGYFAYGFGPGLVLSGGKVMPPAAVVSNLFARKHLVGAPYSILAGNPNGLIRGEGISGVEYTFVEKNDGTGDRDYLNPFGFNLIVNKKNSGGLQLYSNKTSYNTVDSPIGSIHTSEIVMYLQMRIKSLLERYVFQYNTAQNRLIIKTQADAICQEPTSIGAVDRFLNIMDESNNTAEVIANRIGILDTTIWVNNGMEILVHRTKVDTLTNTATFEVLNN